ncbi:DEAD/DEAH box helicase [Bacillus shivajii]|uniref:DEAD/DEAH box helicase n=1 Tax=Bacillus shivajii TaxID=1983719 RepID=UPI001CF98D7B|nr:SNF2 helicase associated domain-containing protein [Bacillus shivajii]UCZ54006.1 DEAD/DEAH box helicase [Bacillus shivajii]
MRNHAILEEKDIEGLCDLPNTYKRGKRYFTEGRVDDFRWDLHEECYKAWVVGSKSYEVKINLYENGTIKGCSCSCPAFQDFTGICKHIVAVLLYMKKKHGSEGERVLSSTQHGLKEQLKDKEVVHRLKVKEPAQTKALPEMEMMKAKNFIHSFSEVYYNKQERYREKELLSVQYELTLHGGFRTNHGSIVTLELKIGPKKLYVVKDIKEFLEAVFEKRSLKFAKHFTYDPLDYDFSIEDRHILETIWKYYQVQEDSSPSSMAYYGSRKRDRRSWTVPGSVFDEVLDLLGDRQVTVETPNGTIHGIDVSSERLPMEFHLEQNDNYEGTYKFTWENEDDFILLDKEYNAALYKETFYKLPTEGREAVHLLSRHFELHGKASLHFEKNELENFTSMVIPQLKQVGDVGISEEIDDLIDMSPLKANLYVDYDEERLRAEVVFHYGEHEFSPFDHESETTEKVVVRDVEQELYLLSLIENIPFKYNGKELYLNDFDEIIDFVFDEIPKLSQDFHLYATSKVKNLMYSPDVQPTVKVETNQELSLLDVSFQMDDLYEDEIDALLKDLLANKKYYRLSNGSFVSLEDQAFQEVKELYEDLDLPSHDLRANTSVPFLKAFQLDHENTSVLKRGKQFKALIEAVDHPEEMDFELPDELQAELRQYQETGFKWIMSLAHYNLGGILADDMGLGKTVQMIAYLLKQKELGVTEPSLIVCPSSLVFNWKKEIERFAPSLNVKVITGTVQERQTLISEEDSDTDVWITSYPLIRRDHDAYDEKVFSSMLLDEAQYVKNDWTKTAKAVKSIRAKYFFALSGTPIENSLDELYSIFDIVLPGLFQHKRAYKEMSQERITKRIRPFVLRRLKKDVLKDLPEKIENVQYTELNEEQKKVYMAQLRLIKDEASDAIKQNAFQENRMKILAGLTRLRQICCHPGMFLENYEGGSGKLERLLDYIEEANANGQRLVIFSQFTTMLAILKDEFDRRGWQYHYLDGSTPSEERLKLADRFNEGEKDFFLISLKAGGTGLNLTGGDTVVLYDSWWNPAVEEQAADRVYRYGQKKVVQVTKLITTGTIEEKIHQLQEQKRELLDQVIQSGETMISSLNKEDIEELLELET